jgi:hypothetical protein
MQDNHWAIKLEKDKNGRVSLKFWGCLNLSLRSFSYLVTLLVLIGSIFSYVVQQLS